jgi:hypothetical protein
MTFQLALSNGARLRLIEINGVLFAVSKMPSATKVTPTSRQNIWAEIRFGTVTS